MFMYGMWNIGSPKYAYLGSRVFSIPFTQIQMKIGLPYISLYCQRCGSFLVCQGFELRPSQRYSLIPCTLRSKSYSNICGQKASTSCLPKSYLMFRDRMNIRRKPGHPSLKICFWNGGSGSFSLSAVPFRGNKLLLDIGALESSH